MKTKILLFPLLLLIIIGALIWFVIPGWKEVQSKKENLSAKESFLAGLQNKNKNVDKLIGSYENKKEDQDFILAYVPKKIEDENVINNIIHYANLQNGENILRVSKIAIAKAEKATSAGDNMEIPLQLAIIPEMIQTPPPAKPTFFNVTVGFSGKYSGVKEFFTNLSKLKRAYGINKFKIASGNSSDPKELSVEADLAFNFIPEYNPKNVDGNFLEENINWQIAEEIRNRMNVDIIGINLDGQGKDNPFLP